MRRIQLLSITLLLTISGTMASAQSQAPSSPARVTLYSPLKSVGETPKAFFDFKTQSIAGPREHWDLVYGLLYTGSDRDWFKISTRPDERTALKDLGTLDWTDSFKVPVLAPLPELKPGEVRHIIVNTSGRDGMDGIDGAPGRSGFADRAPASVIDAHPIVRDTPTLGSLSSNSRIVIEGAWPDPEAPPKRRATAEAKPSKLYIDRVFTKAVAGHMYVIHVVTPQANFYALFRVESLTSGENCTLAWRFIPAPENEVGK